MTKFVDIVRGTARYRVFDNGSVFSFYRMRMLKPYTDKDGYSVVNLGGKAEKVHRLILSCFVRDPVPGEVCRHLDGDPSNNSILNLAWGDAVSNWNDKRIHGRATAGELHGRAKLSSEDVSRLRKSRFGYGELKAEAKRLGVSISAIYKARAGETWCTQ